MAKEKIRCPKCSHEQYTKVECEACGLIFRRFVEVRDRKKDEVLKQETQQARKSATLARFGSALALVAVTAAATYFIIGRPKADPPAPPPLPAAAITPPPAPVPQPMEQQPTPIPTVARTASGTPIEQAKNATVAIETPWGKGSGFFINETTIVTNKHVVEPDRSQLDQIRHQIRTSRQLVTLEQQNINEIRQKINQMQDSPTRRQLIIILKEKEQQLAKIVPELEQAEARLKEMEKPAASSSIKIFLADGSEYTAQSRQLSTKRDLALLSIYSATAPVLKPAPNAGGLKQGDKVYTVGNPVGLRNTVTSGIFSGYRQQKGTEEVLLQTDAPINPGNSGGPLIDEGGRVHGVNTMIIQNTQGIGFAIPIQAVFEEFSLSPPQG